MLEICGRLYGAQHPVVCMDEQPVQLEKDTRESMPAMESHPQRVDYEYEQAGTARVFMYCDPLGGRQRSTTRKRRTKTDWANEVADLLEGRYACCKQVTLVPDDRNTH